MTCQDAREWFSAWVDEALTAQERAGLQAHLDGCADCCRELERFRQTVSLLHAVERPRAPVGFVDRVLEAVAPTPWYRRALRRAFVPLRVKLPLEAAATILVALAAVYVFQQTPELQRAASVDQASKAPQQEPARRTPAAPPAATTPVPAEQPVTPPLEEGKGERDDKAGSKVVGKVDEVKKEAAAEQAAAPPGKDVERERLQSAQSRPAESRADSREERAKSPAAPGPPRAAAQRALAPAHISGRLAISDRDAADRALGELLARVGGREVGRRLETGATVVEAVLPREALGEFSRGLELIGKWTPVSQLQPADLPAEVRVTVRIAQ